MCGIAGIWHVASEPAADLDVRIRRMTEPLRRRGPDDQGTWVSPGGDLALGHRRLAIIDTSPLAHQPMFAGNHRWSIVFNGELYNFREIRDGLEKEGWGFQSGSDTEVVLAAYRKYGPDCLSLFNGMFAFAIWDGEKRELFLARDRFGVKPLFYYWKNGTFLFGSEMKAIRAYGALDLTLNRAAIHRYFYLTYTNSPDTFYNEITRLDAGCRIRISRKSFRCDRWYDVTPHYRGAKQADLGNGIVQLRKTLESAVRSRMVADVPLGAFLSGGVDSTIIVGLMSKISGKQVRTFTIGYRDSPVYDESRFAREAAGTFGTDHTEILLSIRDGIKIIPEVLGYFDQPFGDSSSVATYLISRETVKSVKVALSGDGGDELFAGYSKYQAEAYARYFGFLPGFVRAVLSRCVAGLPEGRQSHLHEFFRRAKKAVRSADPDQVSRHCSLMFPLSESEMLPLFSGDAAGEIRRLVARFMDEIQGGAIDRALYADLNICLKDDMLVKVDMMAMANSLEVRNPFLDFHLVELAAGMPGEWKLKGTTRKYILLSAFRDLLPPFVPSRPKKGFGVPVGEWLRSDLKGLFEEEVSKKNVNRAEILRFDAVDRVFRAHLSGKRDATSLLWSILAFQWWANRSL